MADEPQQPERLELQYRAGQQDLRPVSESDSGCAIFFALIAFASLAGIVGIAGVSWAKRRLTVAEIVAIIGCGLFAAGSIIAVIGRKTRHRWWGNMDWKEAWLPRGRR